MSETTASSDALRLARRALDGQGCAPPRVALVLGSGLGAFADTLAARQTVPYAAIPGMPGVAVDGHAGNLVFGKAAGVPLVAMQGRAHLYEGHSPQAVVFGVRLMITLGARIVVLTNAAGGIAQWLDAGDLMLIEDQINLTGTSCLLGPNDAALGPRFPPMMDAYDARLLAIAQQVGMSQGVTLRGGIYAGVLGPAYETAAEVRMLGAVGAHAVGMSTVLEAIAARHMGARCLGISCITNRAAGVAGAIQDHDEVQRVATRSRARFIALLEGILECVAQEQGT